MKIIRYERVTKILSLIIFLLIILFLISGCIQNNAKNIKMEKRSERTAESRHITSYFNPDKSYIKVTVVENTEPTDFGIEGLKREVLWLIPNPERLEWKSSPSIQDIDGHKALFTLISQVDPYLGTRTNRVPDWFITAIGYPEKNTVNAGIKLSNYSDIKLSSST